MNQAVEYTEIEADVEVAAPAFASVRKNRYGSVPGLDDEELADPEELERQAYMLEFGPVLMLPVKERASGIVPAVDEDGSVNWGAFGTVDFDRTRPAFDRARYKAEKLRDELENVFIMFSIVKERLPRLARDLVLKYLRMGRLAMEDIASEDMRALAMLQQRALRLQEQIERLRESSRDKLQRELEWLTA